MTDLSAIERAVLEVLAAAGYPVGMFEPAILGLANDDRLRVDHCWRDLWLANLVWPVQCHEPRDVTFEITDAGREALGTARKEPV